jgi:hypothetical protein
MPKGLSSLPAAAAQATALMFKTWFTNAVATTFVAAVIIAVAGGLCAFLLRSHVGDAQAATDETTVPAADAVPAAVPAAVAQTGDA